MIKKLHFFFFLLIFVQLNGQITITSVSFPAVGDLVKIETATSNYVERVKK